MNSKPQIIIIGLDAAVLTLVEPWVAEGKLPHLAALIKNGISGTLESVIPPLTPAAWTSFMTGKNPGKHGIYNFMEHQPDGYGLLFTSGANRRAETLWKIANQAGLTVGVMNTPFTYPPEKLNGFQISGLDTPSPASAFIHPPELRKEIEENLGPLKLDLRYLGFMTNFEKRAQVLDELKASDAQWRRLALYLLDKHPQDIMMFTFMSIDTIQHYFWHYMDKNHFYHDAEGAVLFQNAILECYQRLDATVGEIVQRLDDQATVLVVSDHGQAAVSDRTLCINRILAQSGLLVCKPAPFWKTLLERIVSPAYNFLRSKLTSAQKVAIARIFPKMRDSVDSMVTSYSNIDWSKTKAFCHEAWATPPSVSINLKGVKPQGIVEPADYEKVMKDVVAALQTVKDPRTNQPVIQKIYRRDEIYSGPFTDRAPDLTLEWWGESPFNTKPSLGSEAGEPPLKIEKPHPLRMSEWCGNHVLHGILVGRGPRLRSGVSCSGARLIDLAPTILALLGLPIPSDMDGRVLAEILDSQSQNWNYTNPKETSNFLPHEQEGDGYSQEEAELVEERLKNLGYLES
ncbi:MAG TPA: alkaline phosphatase family protein [Candidatus Methylacidiphilales bacterium]|nr:alkaline phosphatase family protein [Candidatus Methylacidiphilales bacterium]